MSRERFSLRSALAPRGLYYGWLLVLTLAITETASWGVLYYAFTIFLAPMHAELGWSRATMTGAFSLALLLSGVTGLAAGRWLDRHGPRALMTAGSVAAVLLVFAWSRVHTLLGLYLVWAAIGVTMAAVLYEQAFVVVATWFRRKRGKALTVLTFLAGFASVIFIPLAGWLVHTQGWRQALMVLAIIVAVVTIPLHALVLRRRPEELGLLPDGASVARANDTAMHTLAAERSVTVRGAVHGATFWWLTGAFFLNTLGGGAIFVHLVPYLTDRGYAPVFAATVTGLVGVMALPGRLVLTPLGDRIPRGIVAAGIFAMQMLALLVLLLVHSAAGVVGFVVLFGAGFGAVTPARAALVAEYYGAASFGGINGVLGFFLTGARALAPVGAGVLYDLTGGYDILLWGLTAASAVAAITILLAERSAQALLLRERPEVGARV